MRLIDADNYCENICRCNKDGCDKGKCPIHNAPTAYNVDKVVAKLEDEKGIAFLTLANTGDKVKDVVYDEVMVYLNTAIELVKAGGAE